MTYAKVCSHCSESFTTEYENQSYCPTKNCAKQAEKKRARVRKRAVESVANLPAPSPGQQPSEVDVEKALSALAVAGTATRASEALEAQGFDMNPARLRALKAKHLSRYHELREDLQARKKAYMADVHENNAMSAAELEAKIRGKLNLAIDSDELSARDLPNAYRNAATVAGINQDKARDLRGESQTIGSTQNFGEILRSLARFSQVVQINPALLDATVVEEKPSR